MTAHVAHAYDETDTRGPWLEFCASCVRADPDIHANVRYWDEPTGARCDCCEIDFDVEDDLGPASQQQCFLDIGGAA